MELTSPKIIKELLSKYETKPSKRLGQNFLIDKNVLSKIIEASDIKPTDIVLEVGPGIGVLTQELAKKAKQIIAVEKDQTMIDVLGETIKDYKNVEIIHGDILKLKINELIENCKFKIENYKVAANIPYYLTSPLIRNMLEAKFPPKDLVLMIQKEVAERICQNPPHMSLLAVSVQFYAKAKIISNVSKGCFWPSPKIDSAIIKIVPHLGGQAEKKYDISPDLFFKVVKAGFSQPRKQLIGNLSKMLKIERGELEKLLLQNNIKPNQRAETLSLKNWIDLTTTLKVVKLI